MKKILLLLSVCALSLSGSAFATEGGGGIYPNGTESYGVNHMPPPGTYLLVYPEYYESSRLNNNAGDRVAIPFNLHAVGVAPRVVWLPDLKILNGQVFTHALIPVSNVTLNLGSQFETRKGLGDTTVGIGLAYTVADNLHMLGAIDISAPTGEYNKNDLLSIGRNYWEETTTFGITYDMPRGFNGDILMKYDYNMKNKATEYTSGQEFHFDYDAGWDTGCGWIAGLGGYFYQQMTDDKNAAGIVADFKGRALAIGPALKYTSASHWMMALKWQVETGVRNRAQGDTLIIKTNIPL